MIFNAAGTIQNPEATYLPSILRFFRWSYLSLAWKLLWLETDSYPQGKDLYDATLLAQQTQLPFALLRQVFEASGDWMYFQKHILQPNSSFPWDIDAESIEWEDLKKEYPHIKGEASDWLTRLSQALAPTYANRDR